MKLISKFVSRLKKAFSDDPEESSVTRIESARVTSTRLNSLKRMRANSPYTPQYKLEEQTKPAKQKPKSLDSNIDLDFGMELPNV